MPKPSASAVFAERLRAVRTKAGISQALLGERIGLTFEVASTRINRYERGKHPPDMDTAERLADELGVPFSYFVERDPKVARVIGGFAELSRDRQEELLSFLAAQLKAQRDELRVEDVKAALEADRRAIQNAASRAAITKAGSKKVAAKKTANKARKVVKRNLPGTTKGVKQR